MKFRNCFLIFGFALAAIQADASQRARLKATLAQSDQPTLELLKARIEAATQNPVPDLLAIAADSTLRNNVRQKAIRALQLYPEDAVRQFLEAIMANEKESLSLRKSAIKSYAAGFHKVAPAKTESELSRYSKDNRLGAITKHSLQKLQSIQQNPNRKLPPPPVDRSKPQKRPESQMQ